LRFSKPTELHEEYYLMEMSTTQVTTLLSDQNKILSLEIEGYDKDGDYIDDEILPNFVNIGEFNNFFLKNIGYDIINCKIELEAEISINTHDDGEATIRFLKNSIGQKLISDIFEQYHIPEKLIKALKDNCGCYISVDDKKNIKGVYENFDDYLLSR
jgi:hypothetical protein